MVVCIALDSFKESASAKEVCESVKLGFEDVSHNNEYIIIPMADGGEGTVEVLINSRNGELISTLTYDPLFREIKSTYGVFEKDNRKIAVIEMAETAGLGLLKPKERNPLITSTYGVGQIIKEVINDGINEIILGIGGSATNDGGVGMAAALGVIFYDENNREIPKEELVGGSLTKIKRIDNRKSAQLLNNVKLTVACDVQNTLYGETGASYVFAKQKGASIDDIPLLDNNLRYYAEVIEKNIGVKVENIKGSGAAGGILASLIAFSNCKIKSGIDIVIEYTDLEKHIEKSDIVITGEGKIDSQTVFGKVPMGVGKLGKKYNKKVIAIAGSLGEGYEVVYEHGIDAVFSVLRSVTTLEEALKSGKDNIRLTSRNIAKLLEIYE